MINFPFVPNGKFIVFRCPKIWAHYSLIIMCLNIETPSNHHFPFETNGKVVVLSVPILKQPGRVAQSVGHLTHKSGVLGSIPGLATIFCFSFRFFKKGSCQLLTKVCARSTG